MVARPRVDLVVGQTATVGSVHGDADDYTSERGFEVVASAFSSSSCLLRTRLDHAHHDPPAPAVGADGHLCWQKLKPQAQHIAVGYQLGRLRPDLQSHGASFLTGTIPPLSYIGSNRPIRTAMTIDLKGALRPIGDSGQNGEALAPVIGIRG